MIKNNQSTQCSDCVTPTFTDKELVIIHGGLSVAIRHMSYCEDCKLRPSSILEEIMSRIDKHLKRKSL